MNKEKVRLTQYAKTSGWAAKVGPETLAQVLGKLPKFEDENLIVGIETSDGAAILDTEKVMEEEHIVRQGALAEEVKAKEKYVQSYINFFLGNVMKCENIEELRECRIGVTPDCMLYHSYRLQHINPENYTRRAYIGEISLRQRIRQLQKHCDELQETRLPLAALVEEAK